jgi:hypothetical protein
MPDTASFKLLRRTKQRMTKTKSTQQLSGIPFGWDMLPKAMPWILDQMRLKGQYSNDDLKNHLGETYAIDTLKVAQNWPENGMKLFRNYVDWLMAKMTQDGWHQPLDNRMYRLTSDGKHKAAGLDYRSD